MSTTASFRQHAPQARLLASNSPQSPLHARPHRHVDRILLIFVAKLSPPYCRPQLEASRSPIVSGPELSLSVKSVATKSRLSSSSESCPSSALFVKSRRTLRFVTVPCLTSFVHSAYCIHVSHPRPTSASNRPPSWHCKRLPRHTLCHCSRTRTLLPSTRNVLLFSPRISHWLGVSGVNATKASVHIISMDV